MLARTREQRDQRSFLLQRGTGFLRSFISVTLGGAIIATIGAALGAV